MNKEGLSWPQISNSSSSIENIREPQQPGTTQDTGKKKAQKESRQALSCTLCRDRKVKCDRTKPCSACCARGVPKDCHFVIADGSTYEPILQSHELRKLRAENLHLKERLRAGKLSVDDEQQDAASLSQPPDGRSDVRAKRPMIKQRKFKDNKSENLYFGSPALASIVNDFANLHIGPRSLSHSMPRKADIYHYASQISPAYPFATMFPATLKACILELLKCLPSKEDRLRYLDAFQNRAQTCSFPHVPDEITTTETERFLLDAPRNAEMFPDMLALIFAALAQGSQSGVFDKCGKKWEAGAMDAEQKQYGDIYIAASMQALRMASFMNRPTLLGIQALIMICPYLTNSGRFLDAWTLFGTVIRLAHSIGLHRNPKYLDPAPPLRECAIRQTLWWWMLHMDQQYSMTLGRPLGISGIGDCPPAEPLTTNSTILRLSEYINQFTVLARQILSSDRLTITKIDWFTDRLLALWDTMPEVVQFGETWLDERKDIPEWPLDAMAAVLYGKTQNYLILLNRQRIEPENAASEASQSPPRANVQQSDVPDTRFNPINAPLAHSSASDGARMPPPHLPTHISSSGGVPNMTKPKSSKLTPRERGRSLVLTSSRSLISAFLFFYHRCPAALLCWTMGQQAFNSCMILLLDALETGDLTHIPHVERAYAIFVELDKLGVHKLAGLAVGRVSWGLVELGKMQRRRGEPSQGTEVGGARSSGVAHDSREHGGNTTGAGSVDTVMGNTGMLLLEDPGLQSFVPESFQPLGWDMAGRDLLHEQYAPPQQRPYVSPVHNPQSLTPPIPFREDNTQQTNMLDASGMTGAQMPFQHIQEQQQQPSQYQPASSSQYHPPTFTSYDTSSRNPLRPLAPYPAYSAALPPRQQATPRYEDTPVHFDLRNPEAMDLGGNPGWAARSAPGGDTRPGHDRTAGGGGFGRS